MHFRNMTRALEYFRVSLDKKDTPIYWVELLFRMAEAGDEGITPVEAAEECDMTQSTVSRTLKLMGWFQNGVTKQMEGYDLVRSIGSDHIHRHRLRFALTGKGKKLVTKMIEILNS